MIRSIRNVFRVVRIARTLSRHDALFPLESLHLPATVMRAINIVAGRPKSSPDRRPGQRLTEALQELGPSFVKFGQSLSMRADLVGEEVAADLAELQDHLPPFSTPQAKQIIESEFDQLLAELYSEFDDEAVAAASIAQVHYAVTTEGRPVAVKVLRPEVEQAFQEDLDLFYWLAEIIEQLQPAFRRLRPVDIVRTFNETVDLEMDLRLEAAAASELREHFEDDPTYRVPEIDWQRTQRQVLTAERIHGIPIDDRQTLSEAGHNLEEVAGKTLVSFLKQVFRDGFFHADMHAGNLFVDEDGNIVAVDFGIMGRLDRETRRFVAELLLAFLMGDYRRAAEVHFEAGYVPRTKSVEAFTQACRSIGEPILGKPVNEISIARLLAQLFRITETFAMPTQPQLLLLQKTMMMVEGACRRLAPEANFWELSKPFLEEWVSENLSAEARVRDTIEDAAATARKFPNMLEKAQMAADVLTPDGIRLHPDSERAIGSQFGSRRNFVQFVLIFVLAIFTLVILFKL